MSRVHQPGSVEITGTGKRFYVNARGEHVPFDANRYRDARPWARGSQRDAREFTV